MTNKVLLQDLCDTLVSKEKMSKRTAETFVRSFLQLIEYSLISEKIVKIKGLGTFKLVIVDKRESVDVNSGERIEIKSHARISFTPDTKLKDDINHPFSHFQTIILNDDVEIDEFEQVDKEWEEAYRDDEEEEEEITEAVGKEEIPESIPMEVPKIEIVEEATEETEAEVEIVAEVEDADAEEEQEPETKEVEEVEEVEEATPIIETLVSDDAAEEPADDNVILAPPTEKVIVYNEANEDADNTESDDDAEVMSDAIAEEDAIESVVELPKEAKKKKHKKKKANKWKIAAIVLMGLLLLILTYFAGYFRVFCPCEFSSWFATPSNTAQSESVTQVFTDSIAHSTTSDNAQPVEESDSAISPKQENAVVPPPASTAPTDAARQSVQPKQQTENKTPPKPAEPQYRQVEGGKYKITGTLSTHTIKSGETLRNIALDVYGSKGYVQYIIRHNNIENPDLVEAGQVIKLPKLVPNEY